MKKYVFSNRKYFERKNVDFDIRSVGYFVSAESQRWQNIVTRNRQAALGHRLTAENVHFLIFSVGEDFTFKPAEKYIFLKLES